MIPIIETYSPFREALRGLQVRMSRRIQKRKWSIVVIGDAGVGKTLLVKLLTGNETNLTYMPTTEIERHNDDKGCCTITEVPGSMDMVVSDVQLLAQYDLIVVVFHIDREGPEEYYRTLWPGERRPPVPVIFVGNSNTSQNISKGKRFWYQIRGGFLYRYFPVALRDRKTCKALVAYLRSGAWSA